MPGLHWALGHMMMLEKDNLVSDGVERTATRLSSQGAVKNHVTRSSPTS